MNEAELHLSLIYTGAFEDPKNWTQEGHLAGLRAVFSAGVIAADKSRNK